MGGVTVVVLVVLVAAMGRLERWKPETPDQKVVKVLLSMGLVFATMLVPALCLVFMR